MTTNPTRILLVDDHAVVREGYRRLLESEPHYRVVAEAASGPLAYRRYLEHRPDVIITDLSLPGVGGIELMRRLRRHGEMRALAFSVHEETVYVERAFAAGALGYLTKRSAADLLMNAVAAVARGERYLSPDLRLPSQEAGAHESLSAMLESLSHREFEIFRQLAEGRPVRQIASGLSISGKTVSNYSSQIRLKLGVQSTADMARLAISMGIVRA